MVWCKQQNTRNRQKYVTSIKPVRLGVAAAWLIAPVVPVHHELGRARIPRIRRPLQPRVEIEVFRGRAGGATRG